MFRIYCFVPMNQTSLLYWLFFFGVCARAHILWLFKYMETFMETLMETLYAGCFAFAGFVPCTGSSYEGEGILWCCASKQKHITPNSHKHVVDPNMLWGPSGASASAKFILSVILFTQACIYLGNQSVADSLVGFCYRV